jgi:hypothetical protein
VVVGFGEIRFGRGVASVTELRLSLDEESLSLLREVRTVAVEATDVITCVRGAAEVRLAVAVAGTAQAAGARLLPRQILEANDLGDVATARQVLGARSVT